MLHPVINFGAPAADNLKRILFFYNDSATDFLHRSYNLHENIHQARLCFKRIRSLLRLGREVLGEDIYQDLNTFYRDQARMLSQFRDITALIEISQYVKKSRRSEGTKSLLMNFRKELSKERKKLIAGIGIENAKKQVIGSLKQQKTILEELQLKDHSVLELRKGIQRVYKRGKELYNITLHETNDHNMHEWRKQVKYLWYQLVVLTPLWPEVFTSLSRQVQTMSQLLGKHHDYVLFESALNPLKKEIKYRNDVLVLGRSLKRNKRHLESQSLKLGAKFYFISPNQLERMIENLISTEINE